MAVWVANQPGFSEGDGTPTLYGKAVGASSVNCCANTIEKSSRYNSSEPHKVQLIFRTTTAVLRRAMWTQVPIGAKSVCFAISIVMCAISCASQEIGTIDVDNLDVVGLTAKTVRLTWDPVSSVECKTTVFYNVFRDPNEDFTPSPANQIASGIKKPTYIATEPVADKDYYYFVQAVKNWTACVPHSGVINVYPIDLGAAFTVVIGTQSGTCTAQSTAEITCPSPLPNFHAVIAEQGSHEYLIGCESTDYEGGSWTCVNLSSGVYHVGVHSLTLTVWDSGMSKANMKTGKTISPITPVFSVLARVN